MNIYLGCCLSESKEPSSVPELRRQNWAYKKAKDASIHRKDMREKRDAQRENPRNLQQSPLSIQLTMSQLMLKPGEKTPELIGRDSAWRLPNIESNASVSFHQPELKTHN